MVKQATKIIYRYSNYVYLLHVKTLTNLCLSLNTPCDPLLDSPSSYVHNKKWFKSILTLGDDNIQSMGSFKLSLHTLNLVNYQCFIGTISCLNSFIQRKRKKLPQGKSLGRQTISFISPADKPAFILDQSSANQTASFQNQLKVTVS